MSQPKKWADNQSAAGNLYSKVIIWAIVAIILVVLYKTGVITAARNWVAGVYSSGSTAVEDSQQNFGSKLSGSRKHREEKSMGGDAKAP